MAVKRVFQTDDGKTFKTRAAALQHTMDIQVGIELREWLQQVNYADTAEECCQLAEFLLENRMIVTSYLTRKSIDNDEDPDSNLDPEETT